MSFEQVPLYVYKSGQSSDGSFLDLVCLIDDYETLSFTKGGNSPGSFQLTLNLKTLNADSLTRGRIIRIGTDNTKSVIISTITKELQADGNMMLSVSGQELWSVLGRRQILPPTGYDYYTASSTTPVETGLKTLISVTMGQTATASRTWSAINVVASGGGGDNYVISERYSNLLEVVSKALVSTNSVLTATLNHTTLKLDIGWSAGTDRTATIFISSDFDTAQVSLLNQTDTGYRNLLIIAGQGQGADRTIITTYDTTEPTGIDRRELFQDARDLSATTSLNARAAQTLAENAFISFVEVEPLVYSSVVFGTDYNIGDKVTLREFGADTYVYITSATEQWSAGNYTLKLGVDKAPATVATQISEINSANKRSLTTNEAANQQAVIMEYRPVISTDYTLSTGRNGLSIGTVKINSGVVVTVPTGYSWTVESLLGEIYDTGTNANGSYVKYSNGVMQCWGTSTTTVAGTSQSNYYGTTSGTTYYGDYTQTMPASYVVVPTVSTSIIGYSGESLATANGLSSFDIRIVNYVTWAIGGKLTRWQSIGFWRVS